MSTTVSIGAISQIPVGEGRSFIVDQQEIAVFRTHAGEIYATQAYCPHLNGPLADGLLGGTNLVCPLHDRTFDLRTGEELGGDCAKLKTFKVDVDNEKMIVTV